MNIFLAGCRFGRRVDGSSASAAIGRWRAQYTAFKSTPVRSWTASSGEFVAYWTAHTAADVGSVDYVANDGGQRFALFTGRPILWVDDFVADGRRAIDASTYLPGLTSVVDRLDGRTAVLRYGDGCLDLYADPHGMQPIFTASTGEVTWLSNNAPLLYDIAGRGPVRYDVLGCFFAFGWAPTGEPLWEPVQRVPRAVLWTLSRAGTSVTPLGPDAELGGLVGHGANLAEAADILVAATAALADWPGRRNLVALTGGRDSRLVIAAARCAGIPCEPFTYVFPDNLSRNAGDGAVAREVCRHLGLEHRTVTGSSNAVEYEDPAEALDLLRFTSPGTLSLDDAKSVDGEPLTTPLPLVHNGVGGEYARSYYGHARGIGRAALAGVLYRREAKSWLRPPLLNDDGRAEVVACLERFVDRQLAAGVPIEDVPEVLFAERFATRFGTKTLAFEHGEDVLSPLMSRRLFPHQLGLPQAERQQERFHLEVLRKLAPQLMDVPFYGGIPRERSLQSLQGRTQERTRGVAERRPDADTPAGRGHGDPFVSVMGFTREVVESQPAHEAWRVLDRAAVRALLAEDPTSLDRQGRFHVWRLATIFGERASPASPTPSRPGS